MGGCYPNEQSYSDQVSIEHVLFLLIAIKN